MRDPDSNLLRTFVTVIEAGSVSAAALKLSRTQAAVSMQLRRLEEDLEQRLLDRSPRGVKLTQAGHVLLPFAQAILGSGADAVRALSAQSICGTVRLGMLEDIASGRLPHALRRFATAYPQVALELVIDNSASLASQLDHAELDLAIGDASYFSAAAVQWQQPLHWVAARGFDLQAHAQALPIVAFGGNCLWQAQVFEALKLVARPWRVVCTSTSLAAVQSAVEAGLGIAVLLRSNIRPESMRTLNGEGLPEAPQASFGLYERGRIDAAPAVSALRHFLAEELHVQPAPAATATPQPAA